jgi:hypothetical protein
MSAATVLGVDGWDDVVGGLVVFFHGELFVAVGTLEGWILGTAMEFALAPHEDEVAKRGCPCTCVCEGYERQGRTTVNETNRTEY